MPLVVRRQGDDRSQVKRNKATFIFSQEYLYL
jgi:hypothetical protein